MTGWKLRVVWPVLDDAMYDIEAITEAWFQLPQFAEDLQVTIADRPRMAVVALTLEQQRKWRAARAVVCEAPVIRRNCTPTRGRKAA